MPAAKRKGKPAEVQHGFELIARAEASKAARRTLAERHAAIRAVHAANPKMPLRQQADLAGVAYDTLTWVLFGYRSSYPASPAKRAKLRRAAVLARKKAIRNKVKQHGRAKKQQRRQAAG